MKQWVMIVCSLFPFVLAAEPLGVIRIASDRPLTEVYGQLHEALESEKFWVVFEADMGSRMERFAKKWGDEYNRNGLGAVKSLVFCNIWWTNRIANADPDLLALCPLHLSLYEKNGETVVLIPRLSVLAEGSPGKDRAAELEAALVDIVKGASTAD